MLEKTLAYVKAEGKEVDITATIKPIQATPELSGKDAIDLLLQTNAGPTA